MSENTEPIYITECPRDAMQGIREFIPTGLKIEFHNELLKCGFDRLDFGSFVSPRAIPQLKDTAEVLKGLDLDQNSADLLAIAANYRGAEDASNFEEINYIGFPFSISEIFQKKNTNKTIDQSLISVEQIHNLCSKSNQKLLIYISMAFGNPYEEHWHPDIAIEWLKRLQKEVGIEHFSLADTIGVSNPQNINLLFSSLIPEFADIEIGAHLHTTPETWEEKVSAAYGSGCRRFDGALQGYGGCPMAKEELTGNMPTEKIVSFLQHRNIESGVDPKSLQKALMKSNEIYDNYH